MKLRKITRYPDSLKEACCALLANENMLTVFVNIVFQNTGVFDYRTVNSALHFIAMLFHALRNSHLKSMPSNFDFQFFFKGIDILLEMDDLVSCDKCLWLIYRIAHLLPSILIEIYKNHIR